MRLKSLLTLSSVAISAFFLSSCAENTKAQSVPTVTPSRSADANGGPQLGTPGGGPVIDKSADSYLQTMIRDLVPKFQQIDYQDEQTGKSMKFNLFVPEKLDQTRKYPLVMFMADASTPGSHYTTPLTQGYGGLVWATEEWQKEHPCYVLVPQFSGVAVDDSYEHTVEVDIAMRMLDYVMRRNNVDEDRVYVTGQSMGGMIAMYYNVTYPTVFAASIFVDSHWNTDDFQQLAEHKFVYFIAGDSGKAFPEIKPLEEAAAVDGVGFSFGEWSAKLPESQQSELAAAMLDKGNPVNIIMFEPRSVLPADGKGSEHMYSFDYAYKIPAVREWLFRQRRSDKY